jgi:diacylglycerol kinase family enzyme
MGRASSASFLRCTKVGIAADEKVHIQVDGDFGGYLPIGAVVLPNALRYFQAD